jgi:hypothetical protein
MHIKLDVENYRKLIELAYLGEWMVNAHHDPDYQDDKATAALQQLLAAQPVAGVGLDEETGEYYMKTDWLEQIFDTYILDYDDHVFWDELTERLAQRDLAKNRGVNIEDVNRDDDIRALKPIEEEYRNEFEDNGIERLEIAEKF